MVTIRLFGMTKSLAKNQSELSLALEGARQVKDLVGLLEAQYPMIGELIQKKKVVVSVNQEIAHDDTEIHDHDDVALLPPFAGGAPEQDVEKASVLTRPTPVRRDAPFTRLCSRIAQGLHVRQRVRLAHSLAAASLNSLFEHPAGYCLVRSTRSGRFQEGLG